MASPQNQQLFHKQSETRGRATLNFSILNIHHETPRTILVDDGSQHVFASSPWFSPSKRMHRNRNVGLFVSKTRTWAMQRILRSLFSHNFCLPYRIAVHNEIQPLYCRHLHGFGRRLCPIRLSCHPASVLLLLEAA